MPRKIIKFAALTAVGVILLYAKPIQAEAPEKPDNSATSYEQQVVATTYELPQHYYNLAVLDSLNRCESGDRYVVIVDTNGYHSYGYFQYQLATFRSYGERYELFPKGLTDEELRELTKDRELQYLLTARILKDGGRNNWYTCSNKLGIR